MKIREPNIGFACYDGVQFRFGYFTGKATVPANNPKNKINNTVYYGAGANLKFVKNENMHVDYEFDPHDPTSQKYYRIQSEKAIIFFPLF